MRHVLFTEPSSPQAGQEMTVYYNPSNTCLNGCSEIYITVSADLISRASVCCHGQERRLLLCLCIPPRIKYPRSRLSY